MGLVEISFIAIGVVGVLGVLGMVAIISGRAPKTINWLNDLGNPYSNVPIDKDGRIAIDWGVYGIPETFIVNSNGIIKYTTATDYTG